MSCFHKLRLLSRGGKNRYECMDCGKRLRILSGVLVAKTAKEAEEYWERKRNKAIQEATSNG